MMYLLRDSLTVSHAKWHLFRVFRRTSRSAVTRALKTGCQVVSKGAVRRQTVFFICAVLPGLTFAKRKTAGVAGGFPGSQGTSQPCTQFSVYRHYRRGLKKLEGFFAPERKSPSNQ